MITDSTEWHYLTMKSLSALLTGVTSNHEEELYCLNCFHSYITKNKLKKHENVCKKHDFCYVEMAKEDNKIIKYNYGGNSMKVHLLFMLT